MCSIFFDRRPFVIVQADADYRRTIGEVRQMKVRNAIGKMVPLATVTEAVDTSGPAMVLRYNMYPAAATNGTWYIERLSVSRSTRMNASTLGSCGVRAAACR